MTDVIVPSPGVNVIEKWESPMKPVCGRIYWTGSGKAKLALLR
jgi:hypothetical protein